MPYKSDKIIIRGTQYDRRVKLNDAQREEIKDLRSQGLSYNAIAKAYDVSKKLIIMVCNPDIAERNRLASIARHREGRYKPTKEQRAATMREHRAFKHKLHKEGKI